MATLGRQVKMKINIRVSVKLLIFTHVVGAGKASELEIHQYYPGKFLLSKCYHFQRETWNTRPNYPNFRDRRSTEAPQTQITKSNVTTYDRLTFYLASCYIICTGQSA